MQINPGLRELNQSFTEVVSNKGGNNQIGCVMSYNERPILHRAFELARTGEYRRVKDLEKALAAEGYARNDPQLHSPSVRKQLRGLCRAISPEALAGRDEAEQIGA
jgi:hypothetical protein